MTSKASLSRFAVVFGLTICFGVSQTRGQMTQLTPGRAWTRLEFSLGGLPVGANPFDPDTIRVDAVFTGPSGTKTTVPAFWHEPYQRSLVSGREVVNSTGKPEWHVRFLPREAGLYELEIRLGTNGSPQVSWAKTNFVASEAGQQRTGFVRIGSGNQYFETGDGQPLKLIGHNVCWHGRRGTYDYDDWFGAMQAAGENFARLWMWPSAFGLETDANSLNRYRLDRAWQLDYVLQLAETRGIFILLCLDYHGMFEVKPDYWGGNNYWPLNPYNTTNGGPCLNANGFFTNSTAQATYQKRLRYLVGRYGYSPNLLAWEFFNEIDNVYSQLRAPDVASWHRVMGDWLHANDPFGHLVTTSLTGSSDRPEIWSLPQMDFAAYHSYGEAQPATRLATVSQSFLRRYRKPVMIGEFGIDFRGWNRSSDPYLRGFRQAVWGGALGGSVGSAMSWWWESIHADNAYPLFTTMSNILNRTGWAKGAWTNIDFKTSGNPPASVGDLRDSAGVFDVTLLLGGTWGAKPSGTLAVASPLASGYSAAALNSFVHGSAHADMRVPFRLSAWFTNNARLVMRLNSVSQGSVMVVRADTTELFRTNLPNLDGGYGVNKEYDIDIPVNLPQGKHVIEISNAGSDWFYLDWVRLERVLESSCAGGWQPSSEAIGLRGGRESLLYVVAPGISYPGGATNQALPLQQEQSLTLTNWPAGTFVAEWFDPVTGSKAGQTTATTTNASLILPLPAFREDLVGVIRSPATLKAVGITPGGDFQFAVEVEPGRGCVVERSSDLSKWVRYADVPDGIGQQLLAEPATNRTSFFRAVTLGGM